MNTSGPRDPGREGPPVRPRRRGGKDLPQTRGGLEEEARERGEDHAGAEAGLGSVKGAPFAGRLAKAMRRPRVCTFKRGRLFAAGTKGDLVRGFENLSPALRARLTWPGEEYGSFM